MMRVFIFLSVLSLLPGRATSQTVQLRIDGSQRLQKFDGIGVNVNTRSWNGKELEPALNLLLDSMHATIWRVIVETVEKWEEVNDNNDPFVMNRAYYNQLYETPKFQKAWEMIRYLNDHGITENLMVNFMGFAPAWMGVKVIKPEMEDEYVEMIASFFEYAINTKHLKVGLIAPTNESDHHQYSEGPHLDAKQHARIMRKLVERMKLLGILGNIRFVGPDCADTKKGVNDFIPAMMQDSVIMSRLAHFGLHSYGSGYNYEPMNGVVKKQFPNSSFWMTEWNQWCTGCDDGILGEYNYKFASASVFNLLQHLKNGASAALVWEGYDSYYEHHAPSPFSYWGVLALDAKTKQYVPRKHFYAIQQVSKFVPPGSSLLAARADADSLTVLTFYDIVTNKINLAGINRSRKSITLNGELANLPPIDRFEMVVTNENVNLQKQNDADVKDKSFHIIIPPAAIFTLSSAVNKSEASGRPEPRGWYAGDIHVHRNCGDERIVPYRRLADMMEPNDLSVISLLADMGNGEVKESKDDLPRVNGSDSEFSTPGRIIHWDTEWHWDAVYSQFAHQALGGHLVLLGLKEAHQIWEESPYKVLDWAGKQNAVRGFAHFQYLDNKIQNQLNCCIPIDYPVEAALKNIEFISEDVTGADAAMDAYYRLLNCGFRLGLAAGTDFPCNGDEPLGTLLTYVQVPGNSLTYDSWIAGIAKGNTVISRNGHSEFLDLKVNKVGPGSEITSDGKEKLFIELYWSVTRETTGTIDILCNGEVIATHAGVAKPGAPLLLYLSKSFPHSSWIAARRRDSLEHRSHTAPVYLTIDKKPIRASVRDAEFFIAWIDNILKNIEPDGPWNRYFTRDQEELRKRYLLARSVYQKIREEAIALKTNNE